MIRVFCTKKIIEMLPKAPQPYTGEIPELDKWCVNLTTIQRRKAVIAICADTRYGFVLWGLKKAEFEKLPELISNGIRETFNYYGIRAEVADAYLSGLPVLCTGSNRKDTARLNRLTIDVSSMRFDSQLTDLLPIGLASIINDIPVDVTTKNAFFPLDRMLEKLKEKYGMNPICRPAFEITARMDLDVTEARRVVLVPASYTFEELHLSLQAAFGWKNYHMYEFNIGQERISCTDEWDDEETPKLASDTVLSDYLKEGDELVYYYDFGDSWEVSIRVTSLIPDFDKPGPECTECEGAAPPEDVGGVPGFVDESGQPTGHIISRDDAHTDGILHRTAHVWVVRKTERGYEILLQKRSEEKESFPGLYDTSSAGHIPAGDEPLESALRELKEELGIAAASDQLHYAGSFRIQYEKEFHGRMFRDNEVTWVYVYEKSVDISALKLQESEVSEVRWFDMDEVWDEIKTDRSRFCVPTGGLNVLREYLKGREA